MKTELQMVETWLNSPAASVLLVLDKLDLPSFGNYFGQAQDLPLYLFSLHRGVAILL